MDDFHKLVDPILYYCGSNKSKLSDAEKIVSGEICTEETKFLVGVFNRGSEQGKPLADVLKSQVVRRAAHGLARVVEQLPKDVLIAINNVSSQRDRFNALVDTIVRMDPTAFSDSINSTNSTNSNLLYQENPEIGQLDRELKASGIAKTVSQQQSHQLQRPTSSSSSSSSRCVEDVECQKPVVITDVDFNTIAGQEATKNRFRANYIFPFVCPGLFPERSKGILLYGPPGTGKTMFAKAATNEIKGAVFFAPSPGDLRGKYEGDTEKAIKNIFDCANNQIKGVCDGSEATCAIIFLDEADSVMGVRTSESATRSTNSLLQGMDGIKSNKNVSTLAATNLPWSIDPAALRRFSEKIFIDKPDRESMEWLIRDGITKAFRPLDLTIGTIDLLDSQLQSSGKTPSSGITNRDVLSAMSDITPNGSSFKYNFDSLPKTEQHDIVFRYLDLMLYLEGGERCAIKGKTDAPGRGQTYTTVDGREVTAIYQPFSITESVQFNTIISLMSSNEETEKIIKVLSMKRDIIEPPVDDQGQKMCASLEEIKANPSNFKPGYSASDVTMVVQIAKRNSSLRSMEGLFKAMRVNVRNENGTIKPFRPYEKPKNNMNRKGKVAVCEVPKTENEDDVVYVSCSLARGVAGVVKDVTKTGGDEGVEFIKYYYIKEYMNDAKLKELKDAYSKAYTDLYTVKRGSTEDVQCHTDSHFIGVSISSEEGQKILPKFYSFHICDLDFIDAVNEYASSIKVLDYIDLLRYAHLGISPSSQ